MQGHHHLTTHLPFPGSLTTTFLSPWDSHMLTPKLTLFPWMHYPFPSGELDMIPLPLLPCSLKTFMKITGMKVKRIPEFQTRANKKVREFSTPGLFWVPPNCSAQLSSTKVPSRSLLILRCLRSPLAAPKLLSSVHLCPVNGVSHSLGQNNN